MLKTQYLTPLFVFSRCFGPKRLLCKIARVIADEFCEGEIGDKLSYDLSYG